MLVAFGVAAVLSAVLLALNGVLAARTLPPPQVRRLRARPRRQYAGWKSSLSAEPNIANPLIFQRLQNSLH
jgi:hypothetical protein